MRTRAIISATCVLSLEMLLAPWQPGLRADERSLDFSGAVFVTAPELTGPANQAVRLLVEEVKQRTQITLRVAHQWPPDPAPVIVVGKAAQIAGIAGPPSNRPALGPPRDRVAIAAQGKEFIEDQGFFGTQAGVQTEGYIVITSDGPRLAGSVVFGDSASSAYSTALPLVATLRTAMVFSHVASNLDYYMGIAIVNPGSAPAEATIEVFARERNRIASGTESIPAGGKKSMPLTDYVGGLKGKNLSSGYVKVTAPREVAGFALFGTNKGTALAACPPNWEQPLQQEEMRICPTFRDEHFYGNQ